MRCDVLCAEQPSRILTSSNDINGIESEHVNEHVNNNEELLPSLEEEKKLHEEKADKRFELASPQYILFMSPLL